MDLNIAFSQSNTIVGDIDGNCQIAINDIIKAKENGAELLLFPELFISGYLAKDLFSKEGFADKCIHAISQLLPFTEGITVVIGNVSKNENKRGKALFNSAYVLRNQQVENIYHKQLLPTYDIFDESRYFEPGTELVTIALSGKHYGLSICEDIWQLHSPSIYKTSPILDYKNQSLDGLINIAASPFHAQQHTEREKTLITVNEFLNVPIYYCNSFGAHTNIIFDGRSSICQNSSIIKAPFASGLQFSEYFEIDNASKYERIEQSLILGIRDYFKKLGFTKAILGLSGGVDSALVAALASKALGANNVYCIMMPSKYSSDHSISDSEKLVSNLGCKVHTIAIEDANQQLLKDLAHDFDGTEPGIAEENLQSRLRAILLMAVSNKHGHLLLNTSNKSESAVGYGTLYGDMCGAMSPIADLYKTEVYELCEYINRDKEIIPKNILTKAPSAELRPDQKDSDSLPDYAVLDAFLFQYIEEQRSLEYLETTFGSKIDVNRIIKMVNMAEYKRYQLPPVLRVSKKSFGEGRQLPIVGKYAN
jgi:NAD+ synthase (glutamine-hydrolysing)